MAIQFNTIPNASLRVPLFYAEINGAQTPYVSISRLLLCGQMHSTGAAEPGVPVHVQGDPRDLFGVNSMLVDMVNKARLNAPFQEIWALPMLDAEAGVKATASVDIDVTGLNASSSVVLWIGEVPVRTVVYTSDDNDDFGARLAAAINATEGCPATAAYADDTITLTARHKGTAGNSIYIDTDYYGTEGPLSSTLFTITQFSGGTGDPDFTTALDNLADEPFDWMVGPYTDGTNFAAFESFLNPVSGRWSPYQQIYGHYVGVKHANVSDLMTAGALWNSPTTSIFGIYRAASPSWCWAGAIGGRMAAHLSDAPELSRPLQTLDLIGILPPKRPADRPNLTDRNSLYFAGISSYHVTGKTRIASIDRLVTNYRLNEWGMPDASWLDVETRAQSMFAIRSIKAAVTGQYGRAALMDTNPDGLQGIATPRDIRAVIVHEYKRLNALGVVENPEVFQSSLIVERSAQDANRVDCYLPIDVVNQLRIIAVNATMFLQRQAA